MELSVSQRVLSGIITSKDEDRYWYAKQHLEAESFSHYDKLIFEIIDRLFRATGKVPSFSSVSEALPYLESAIDTQFSIREIYLSLEQAEHQDEEQFRFAVFQRTQEKRAEVLSETANNVMEILAHGKKISNEELYGIDDARQYNESQLAYLDRFSREKLPEGDIREDVSEMMDMFGKGPIKRIATGFDRLDHLTGGGVGYGELWFLAAYTNEGKSFISANMAYNMCIAGHNVVYITNETGREIIMARIINRHARNPKFGHASGLLYDELFNEGKPELYESYKEIVEDFHTNKQYGRLYVVQIEEGDTVSTIRSKLEAYQKNFEIGAVFIDELALVKAGGNRKSEREDLAEVVQSTRALANTFNGGKKIPIICPWQVSRDAYKEALANNGEYGSESLGNTAEAERRAAVIVTFFRRLDAPNRLKCKITKNRSGRRGDFELAADYATSYVGPVAGPADTNSNFSLSGLNHG